MGQLNIQKCLVKFRKPFAVRSGDRYDDSPETFEKDIKNTPAEVMIYHLTGGLFVYNEDCQLDEELNNMITKIYPDLDLEEGCISFAYTIYNGQK